MSVQLTKNPMQVMFSQHNVEAISPDERICAICQEMLQNTAENPVIGHANATGAPHLFDLHCIAGPLAEKAVCPICVKPVANAEDYANAQIMQNSADKARKQGEVYVPQDRRRNMYIDGKHFLPEAPVLTFAPELGLKGGRRRAGRPDQAPFLRTLAVIPELEPFVELHLKEAPQERRRSMDSELPRPLPFPIFQGLGLAGLESAIDLHLTEAP